MEKEREIERDMTYLTLYPGNNATTRTIMQGKHNDILFGFG